MEKERIRVALKALVDGFVNGCETEPDEEPIGCGWGYIDGAETIEAVVEGFATYLMENCR